MVGRTMALRAFLVVVVLAAAVTVALLAQRPASEALDPGAPTTPVAAPTSPEPAPPALSTEPAPTAEPAAQIEPVTASIDDPATVYVEDDFLELPPVDLDAEADFGNSVVVTLDEVERVEGTGAGPGEVAGPSVLVTLTLRNVSDDAVDLGAVVVDLYTATDALGTPLLGDERTDVFEGVAEPGEAVTATYVMRVPDASPQIKVTVSYEAETPAVTFLGDV